MDATPVHETIDNRGKEKMVTYSCPHCRLILFTRPNYCGRCGTPLRWPEGVKRWLYEHSEQYMR
jgi:uncharacterized OB-fold protein